VGGYSLPTRRGEPESCRSFIPLDRATCLTGSYRPCSTAPNLKGERPASTTMNQCKGTRLSSVADFEAPVGRLKVCLRNCRCFEPCSEVKLVEGGCAR
jgi:hypothetical protein